MTKTSQARLLAWLLCAASLGGPAAAQGPWIDSPMYRDPDLTVPGPEYTFPPRALALWLRALERPDADTKVQAARAVVKARGLGVTGLEASAPALLTALKAREQHPAVRLATAQALVTLGDGDPGLRAALAPALWEAAGPSGPGGGGADLREVVEPALARWDHPSVAAPVRAAWLARLDDPDTPTRALVVAIQCLGQVKEVKAAPRLRDLVLETTHRSSGPVRLEAARALAWARTTGTSLTQLAGPDAARLARAPGMLPRLLAASLLTGHEGPETVTLLQTLAQDRDPSVAAVAAGRLVGLDPAGLPVSLRDHLLGSPDPTVRDHGVTALERHPKGPDTIPLLGKRLDDVHPALRARARAVLRERAEKSPQDREAILAAATLALGKPRAGFEGAGGPRKLGSSDASPTWRAQEQAAILLADLDHKPAGVRLTQLLAAPRAEVYLTAAWALRRLDEPATVPAALAYLEAEQKRFSAGSMLAGREGTNVLVDHQLSQLIQFLARRGHAPAEGVMRRLVPRNGRVFVHEARAAAVWGLGVLHATKPVADLAGPFEERLNDTSSMPPEDGRVRRMAALSLGRLGAKAALPSLTRYQVPSPEGGDGKWRLSGEAVADSCLWAAARIEGRTVTKPAAAKVPRVDWFLTPVD